MKKLLATLICLPAFFGFAYANTITVFDSITNPPSSTDYTGSVVQTSVYSSFSTVNPDFVVTDIQLLLNAPASPPPTGALHIGIYSDSMTSPAGQLYSLGTLTDTSIASSLTGDFDFIGGFLLDTPGRYWIGVSSVGTTTTTAAWDVTYETGGTGVSSEYWNVPVYGTFANTDYDWTYQMQVSGFQAPEPSTILLGAIGLAMLAAYRRRVAS